MIENHSLETGLNQHFHQSFLGRIFFMVAKSFRRKQVGTKKFLSEMFYGCKIISWEIGLNQKFSSKNFLVKTFLLLQNHFLKNRIVRKKKFHQKFFGRKLCMVVKSFARK